MDHPLDENVLETEKYAFLLGCSLRENNLEQFFSVYDAILPKHLSERQLEQIKDRARQIAELPDSKFDVLVLSARDFSLAQGGPRMSGIEAKGPGTDSNWNAGSDEEEDGGGTDGKSGRYGVGMSTTYEEFPASRALNHETFVLNMKGLDCCERDSGLPSSGKGAGSLCENDMSDSEDRCVFDYYPSSDGKGQSFKISHPENPDFDEIHDVESDKSSIESPRSDASSTNEYNVTNPNDEEGTEMKMYSFEESPHKQLYRHNNEIPYARLSEGEDDDDVRYPASYQQRQSLRRSVDDPLNLTQFSRTAEEAERGGLARLRAFAGCSPPPFGMENQFENVQKSISSLLSNSYDEDTRKKLLKKKKGSKDDADERLINSKGSSSSNIKGLMSHDVNGNPIDPLSCYRQMRELPSKAIEGSTSRKLTTNYGTYSQHGEFPHLESISSHDGGFTDRNKKPRKRTKEPVKLTQDIDNYVGDTANVDDLVKFIETGEKNQKKKISQKTSPGGDLVPKSDKVAKKSKDKKVKVGQAEESTEVCINSGEIVTSPTVSTCEVPLSPSPPPPELSPVVIAEPTDEQDMGNSGDKSAVDSNVADSETQSEEKHTHKFSDVKPVIQKESDTQPEKISSSKSPPLHKKELEQLKDKNKVKAKEKEKPLEAAQTLDNNKKPKGKTGKPDLPLKNNKKIENKNDIINNTIPIEKMKVENGPILVVTKTDSELSLTENQHYIFTDLDLLPPVEPEFTLVSKKKKRQGVKDIIPEIPRPKNGPREHRVIPPPRSVTPPPTATLLKKEQSRDLSPSSFPALGKKASAAAAAAKSRATFREGRRNSFGDVPIDSLTELRSQDDSDIESVKSLPAAKGGSLSDVVSSRFPVSYAKMAAAPKAPNSPTSPKQADEYDEDDLLDSQSDTDNSSSRKPTVWKGSPTERRHSIGSSPEDTKPENSPKFTQRSRQKSGSQECLLNVEPAKSDMNVSVPGSELSDVSVACDDDVKHVSSCSEHTFSEDVSSPQGIQIPETMSSPNTSESQSIPTITVTMDSNKVSNVLKTDNGPKVDTRPSNGPQRTDVSNSVVAAAVTRSHSAACSNISKDFKSKPVTMTRVSPNNNNSRRNNKSVIFLDKRFGDAPENLGITFGFDSNLEQTVEFACDSELNVEDCDIPHEPTPSSKDPIIHNQMEPQSIPVNGPADINPAKLESSAPQQAADKGSEVVPGSGVTMGSGVNVGSVDPVPSSVTSKVSKTRVGGLNGVVMPKTQGYRNKSNSDALRTECVATSELKSATASSASYNKDNNKTVLIFYGDGIVAKVGNSNIDSREAEPSSQQPKGRQLAFSPEPNHKGKFNVNEAVRYLKQEWDRVMEQKDKNPQAVQFYNGQ